MDDTHARLLEFDAAVRAATAANAALSQARAVLKHRGAHAAAASQECAALRGSLASLRADVETQRIDMTRACAAISARLRRPAVSVGSSNITDELARFAVSAERRATDAQQVADSATARAHAAELKLALLSGEERALTEPDVVQLKNALLLVVKGAGGEVGAAAEERLRLFASLAGDGADVGARDDYGSSVLALAVSSGATPIARHLLEHTVAECDTCDSVDANTPLHHAAKAANLVLVQLLLQRGADARRKGQDGRTALGIAIERALEATESVALLRKAQFASGGSLE